MVVGVVVVVVVVPPAADRFTTADLVAVPSEFVQVSVYVRWLVSGMAMSTLPWFALAPLQSPEAVQLVPCGTDQVSVVVPVVPPARGVVASIVNPTLGLAVGLTVIVEVSGVATLPTPVLMLLAGKVRV